MKITQKIISVILLSLTVLASSLFASQSALFAKLAASSSSKHLVETAADHGGSLTFSSSKAVTVDSIHIVAFLVEFYGGTPDTNPNTTGDGKFGIGHDKKEQDFYNLTDTPYIYDKLPHKNTYFKNQLDFVKQYYSTVSRGKLHIEYTLLPATDDALKFTVPKQMSIYSPGSKDKRESYSSFDMRKTVGLMKFVRDAIQNADKPNGPFTGMHEATINGSNVILDSLGHKTVFLIFHAGASVLTDGGVNGSATRDTPSDMIDAFITKQYFNYFKDSIGLKTPGVKVSNGSKDSILIDEIMLCSETSNQDGLNFGIHGVLVNQIARQLGIPDLYSTSSGMTAVGGFCIMDPYGYSAANGFIPPYPSAWVRAFMGWDSPKPVRMGQANTFHIKSVCSASESDTSILLVPINDHEYYLIENRQRIIGTDTKVLRYDTLKKSGSALQDTIIVDPFTPVNLKNKTISVSKDESKNILSVPNYDVGIPASGILVWHIDEKILKDRINYDLLNADSNFKAVNLEEADGIDDIGIMGRDFYGQPVFDFGGAADVFPHKNFTHTSDSVVIDSMDAWTHPSTHANDGGQTYLSMKFAPVNPISIQGEYSKLYDSLGQNIHLVRDFTDSIFSVSVKWDFLTSGWPKKTVPEQLFDPAVFGSAKSKKLAVVSTSGKLYVFPANGATIHGSDSATIPYDNLRGELINQTPANKTTIDSTVVTYNRLPGANSFPTTINEKLLVPSNHNKLYIVSSISDSSITIDSSKQIFKSSPSTYICKLLGKSWAIGCVDGTIAIGDTGSYGITDSLDATRTITLGDKNASVNALAVLPQRPDSFVCIQSSNRLSLCRVSTQSVVKSVFLKNGVEPYSIVTGDLDKDNSPEIIVSDSRKGLWVYKEDLTLAPGWSAPADSQKTRRKLPYNTAPVALADLNGDGYLDIISGDVQGVYAYNYKGVLISGWPMYLDNRDYHGNVTCSPVVVKSAAGPQVLYHAPSGENETWEIDSIMSVNKSEGVIYYIRRDNSKDSISGLTASFIDTLLVQGDSLISPIVHPGGYVDAISASGKRPLKTIGKNQLFSNWPLTVGGTIGTSPLVNDLDGEGSLDLIAVSLSGWVYRWKLDKSVIGDSVIWQQLGYNNARQFAYLGAQIQNKVVEKAPISFHSYPNPTNGSPVVIFKYKFNAPAENVRLDVFTMAGLHVYSRSGLSGSYPDWNEVSPVSLALIGPGIYRCRLEAQIAGKKQVQYWKMAVVK